MIRKARTPIELVAAALVGGFGYTRSMRRKLALLLLAFAALPAAAAEPLAPGSAAPPFSLHGSDGETYTLAQFVGKQAVVLAWFPKAFSPG